MHEAMQSVRQLEAKNAELTARLKVAENQARTLKSLEEENTRLKGEASGARERVVLLVASGTARMDNRKVKVLLGGKPKMLGVDEVADITGHEVGGVCPFGLKIPLPVYCDVSLKAFDEVVPAAGSIHSAVRITPSRMAELVAAEWVDVCEIRSQQ